MNADWKVEKAQYAEFNVPTCGKIASWQLCRETQPVWNSHDGLNLTCVDQCHGVRSHGTSSSQGWRQRIVIHSTVWIWSMSSHPCFSRRWLLQVRLGKLSHRRMPLWTSVFFCGCASNAKDSPKASPRPAQRLFSNTSVWTTAKSIFPMKERWGRLRMLRYDLMSSMCQHVPTLQFVSCAEKHSLCGTVMMAWIWHVWINAMVLVPMAQAPPKAGAKELWHNSLNLIQELTSLFSLRWLLQVCLGKPSHGSMPLWTSVFFCAAQATPKIRPRPAQRLFSNTSVWTTAKSIFPMKERWGRLRMLRYDLMSSMCQHVPILQFVSCAEKHSLCGTVMMAWCLDQCHGVGSHGTSSSQGWAKELSRNSLNLIQELTSLFSPEVIVAGLPGKAFPRKHAFVDISVFLCCASNARFAQGQPKKELYRTTKSIAQKWMLIERWRRPSMLSSMCQHVARLQVDSCAEKHSLCGTVMMAWIWHVWINAMVLVPMAQAPPNAGAKELSRNSLNLIQELTSLFSPEVIVAGLPGKAFPRKHAFVDISVFLCCASNAKDSPKASPRPAQRLFSNTSVWTTAKSIFPMKERWGRLRMLRYDEFNVPTCANFAVCQLCIETRPVWNSHDGLNLTCLDQCHGVGSHDTSSSQGWRKRIVTQQSEFDPGAHILVFAGGDCCRFAWESLPTEACLCGHQCFSVLRKQRQRFAQGQPKGYFQTQVFELLLNQFSQWKKGGEGCVCWDMMSSMCQHVPTLQFVSCAEKHRLCGTVMMAWISHVWINAMVLVPMAQAPRRPQQDNSLIELSV